MNHEDNFHLCSNCTTTGVCANTRTCQLHTDELFADQTDEIAIRADGEVKIRAVDDSSGILTLYEEGKPLMVWDPDRRTLKMFGLTYSIDLFETFGTVALDKLFTIAERIDDDEGGGVITVNEINGAFDMREAIESAASQLRLHGPVEKTTLADAIRRAYWIGVHEGRELEKGNVDTDKTSG